MKKIAILLLIIFLSSCSFINQKNDTKTTKSNEILKKENNIKTNTKTKKITTISKIKQIKNNNDNRIKYATRWLIITWTIHLKNDEYILALKNFLNAYKNRKWDSTLEKKIADTYYIMKNWNNAFKYYDKITSKNINYKNKFIDSYLYSLDINKLQTNTWYLSSSINNIKNVKLLNNQEKFYYSNSLECIKDFSLCKKNFADYIEKIKENKKDLIPELINVEKALIDYKNFKIDELYFKNTLVIWAFFKNNNFPVVIILWKNILEKKPNYKPILKMISQSDFELWNYKEAKIYLTKYYALDSNDKDVLYLLALISQKTHDYVLSNIYLTKAAKLWYQPVENIYRLQVYNAYILDDTKSILQNFNKLINSQENPSKSDLILATYYNLINSNINTWEKYAQLWIKLYPKIEDFYWFEWWILIEKKEYKKAKLLLEKWYSINKNNALINLNLGRLEEAQNNNIIAMLYYKRAIQLDNWWEITKIATEKLNTLKNKTNTWSVINNK